MINLKQSFLSLRMQPNYLYINICHPIAHIVCLNFFAKEVLWKLSENPKYIPKLWPHLKTIQTFLKITNEILLYKYYTHTTYCISSISICFFPCFFVLSEIQTNSFKHVPNFPTLHIWTFWSEEPKNANFTFSFLVHYPQPKQNQKSLTDPNLILILTMKQVYTYFWWMLRVICFGRPV